MSRDVIIVGSTMRIPLLYRCEYSQWRKRFMNYLEEPIDGETMINSIQNDPKFWTAEEKKTRKIDCLARSLLIQGLPNDIYSLIDSNKTAKDLWDALERQMCGSEYGEQDKKAVILYEYETFKANEGEQLFDTYLHYLQAINDLKKCSYKKDNCKLNYRFLNNLQQEWKQYATLMRQTKNLMDININALYNILKQNQGDVNDALGYKKKGVVITSNPLALVAEKTNVSKQKEKVVVSSNSEGSECKKAKVKDYNYYKTKMLLAKKDNDEQMLLAEDQAWMESSSDYDQEINTNMVFMAQIEKNDDLLAQTKVLQDQLQVKHVVIDTHVECYEKYAKLVEERYEYMIRYSALFDNDKQHKKQIVDQEVLFDKMSVQLVELDKHKYVWNVYEDKIHKMGQTNQTVHMIMPSKDILYNARKGIGFENPRYFEKAKDLRPSLYDEKVIGLGHTLMFLTHSDKAFEIEKFKRSRENKIEFAYDYGNLNASYVNEKINFEDDYFQEIINPDFKKIDSPFEQTSSLKPYVLNVILEKIIIDLEDEVVNLLEKKVNFETIESLKSKGFESSETVISELENQNENDCQVVEKECDKVENPNHMTGNRALLTNFMEMFLGTVRFGNNDFAVIAGYGDVVIGSM
nr:hypothetical protein [Tanacetum cinerariifolium]